MEKYLSTDGLPFDRDGRKTDGAKHLLVAFIGGLYGSQRYVVRRSFRRTGALNSGRTPRNQKQCGENHEKGKKVLSFFHCWLMGAIDYQLWVRERIQKEEYDESALPKEIYVTRELYDEAFKLYTDRWQRELEKMSRKHKK